jgi:hypothetical protein
MPQRKRSKTRDYHERNGRFDRNASPGRFVCLAYQMAYHNLISVNRLSDINILANKTDACMGR